MNSTSKKVLEIQYATARAQFHECKKNGIVEGDFQDNIWQYRGSNILFIEVNPKAAKTTNNLKPLPIVAGQLARCFAIKEIMRKQSAQLVIGRLAAIRHLSWVIVKNRGDWTELTRSILDKTVALIKDGRSDATAYHWATALNAFVDFLNQLTAKIDGIEHRFTDRFIRWKHKVPNATRLALELTSSEFSDRENDLYTPDLHIGLARARSMVKNDPSIEPSPGYDRIRLEATCFAMALGLRVGEICGLAKNCLDTDPDTGVTFVRVPTEKGAICAATAVADIWTEPLNESFQYLTEICEDARKRALEIETFGFRFIDSALEEQRKSCPLKTAHLRQLKSLELSPNNYYLTKEITDCFSISSKEFNAGGRFHGCTQELPRYVAAQMVCWLDERFKLWDWSSHTNEYKANLHSVSVYDVGKHCGASRSSVSKAKWFIDDLRDMLKEMQHKHLFDPSKTPILAEIVTWRLRWLKMRTQMLSNKGGGAGGPCVIVNINEFKRALETKYRHYLKSHFKEQFPMPEPDKEAPFSARNSAPGHTEKLSDHLIVLWENQFNHRAHKGIIPRPIFRADFHNYLSSNSSKLTIFQRLKLEGEDGNIYSISPHQIRRWVTTAILRSGPYETAVDLWMGRTPHQSRYYDYRTAKERAEYVRSMYITDTPPEDYLGKKVIRWRSEALTDEKIEQLVVEKLRVLNYTPWGGCSRQLYLNPCNKGLMCLRGFGTDTACESFHINVDDLEAKESIESLRANYEPMLRSILENYDSLATDITKELDHHQPLDQHILFISDIVHSCNEALKLYNTAQKEEDE